MISLKAVMRTPAQVFADYLPKLRTREGGYTNDPRDAGGETIHGITVLVARANGYQGNMRAMSWETARGIYEAQYFEGPAFDQVALLDADLAERLLDCGINCGTGTAGRMLQRALNVLNNGATAFPDMVVDGRLGAVTLFCLREFYRLRGNDGRAVLLSMVRGQHVVRYMEIAEGKPSQEVFEYGWQLNRGL